MTYRVAINGFGLIGRDYLRCVLERDRRDPTTLGWRALSVDLVIEATGRLRAGDDPAVTDLHGGPVRTSTCGRYRQRLTHRLGTWHDQFGESGCVGCGRCIAWCPVGIDVTEEAGALAAETEEA